MMILLLPLLAIVRLATSLPLIDQISSAILIYGTYRRKELLSSRMDLVSKPGASVPADDVYEFLIMSLTCWVASSVLEFRSVRFLTKFPFGRFNIRGMSWTGYVCFIVGLLASINSCYVMLSYSRMVHQSSFDSLSQYTWIILSFCCAALSKNTRVLLQGLIFTSWIGQTWVFLRQRDIRRRKVMARIAFSNGVMLVQSFILLLWSDSSNEHLSFKVILTLLTSAIDFIYRFIVLLWCIHNSFCCIGVLQDPLTPGHILILTALFPLRCARTAYVFILGKYRTTARLFTTLVWGEYEDGHAEQEVQHEATFEVVTGISDHSLKPPRTSHEDIQSLEQSNWSSNEDTYMDEPPIQYHLYQYENEPCHELVRV